VATSALSVGVALTPALGFVAALLFIDSYKLIRPSLVFRVLVAGALAALAALVVNTILLGEIRIDFTTYARLIAPLVEEFLKGILIVILVRRERIGFMVDAAIIGFAIGSGFAIVENLQYLRLAPHAPLSTWLVRGFGTALMHGGATALFAAMALSVIERRPQAGWLAFVPGFLVAVSLHAAFNFLSHDVVQATLGVLVGVPTLLLIVFHVSEKTLRAWIGTGFDHDAQMLDLLNTGAFSTSPAGRYLETIKQNFSPMMRFDALCYLRLSCELSLRAKGLLMLRENGFTVPPLDDTTRASLDELRHLEKNIGAAGLRVLRPMFKASGKDLWQLLLLESTATGSLKAA
jgi:RsiW-degrading membrane proteinase PrsW (M82 family)